MSSAALHPMASLTDSECERLDAIIRAVGNRLDRQLRKNGEDPDEGDIFECATAAVVAYVDDRAEDNIFRPVAKAKAGPARGDQSSSQSASTDTASLMGRNIVSLNREVAHLSLRLNWIVDRLHVRLVALEDQGLVAFCFRAWPGNTRRRRSESRWPDAHFAEKKVENNVCGCATGSMDVATLCSLSICFPSLAILVNLEGSCWKQYRTISTETSPNKKPCDQNGLSALSGSCSQPNGHLVNGHQHRVKGLCYPDLSRHPIGHQRRLSQRKFCSNLQILKDNEQVLQFLLTRFGPAEQPYLPVIPSGQRESKSFVNQGYFGQQDSLPGNFPARCESCQALHVWELPVAHMPGPEEQANRYYLWGHGTTAEGLVGILTLGRVLRSSLEAGGSSQSDEVLSFYGKASQDAHYEPSKLEFVSKLHNSTKSSAGVVVGGFIGTAHYKSKSSSAVHEGHLCKFHALVHSPSGDKRWAIREAESPVTLDEGDGNDWGVNWPSIKDAARVVFVFYFYFILFFFLCFWWCRIVLFVLYVLGIILLLPVLLLHFGAAVTLGLSWRASFASRRIPAEISDKSCFYRLKILYGNLDNPDQRIAQDIGNFTRTSVTLIQKLALDAMKIALNSAALIEISPRLFYTLVGFSLLYTFVSLVFFAAPLMKIQRRVLAVEVPNRKSGLGFRGLVVFCRAGVGLRALRICGLGLWIERRRPDMQHLFLLQTSCKAESLRLMFGKRAGLGFRITQVQIII
ncbi:unnamed protein product [Symbiodinium microadriaticum]|nr:unnamed protein product [Symbiodinium microadriaticum]